VEDEQPEEQTFTLFVKNLNFQTTDEDLQDVNKLKSRLLTNKLIEILL